MPIQGRRGTVSNSTYRVRGDTLEAISAAIARSGPTDINDGHRRGGSCAGTLVITLGSRDVTFETTPNGHRFRATCTVTGGTVAADCVITMPVLDGTGLSATAQREWDRYLGAVETHETGHIPEYVAEAVAVAAEIAALTAEGDGTSERAAQRGASGALSQMIRTRFDLRARASAAAARYDARNNHGRSQGAVLDGTIA